MCVPQSVVTERINSRVVTAPVRACSRSPAVNTSVRSGSTYNGHACSVRSSRRGGDGRMLNRPQSVAAVRCDSRTAVAYRRSSSATAVSTYSVTLPDGRVDDHRRVLFVMLKMTVYIVFRIFRPTNEFNGWRGKRSFNLSARIFTSPSRAVYTTANSYTPFKH